MVLKIWRAGGFGRGGAGTDCGWPAPSSDCCPPPVVSSLYVVGGGVGVGGEGRGLLGLGRGWVDGWGSGLERGGEGTDCGCPAPSSDCCPPPVVSSLYAVGEGVGGEGRGLTAGGQHHPQIVALHQQFVRRVRRLLINVDHRAHHRADALQHPQCMAVGHCRRIKHTQRRRISQV